MGNVRLDLFEIMGNVRLDLFEIMSNVRLDLFEMAVDAYSRLKRGLPFLYPFEICL